MKAKKKTAVKKSAPKAKLNKAEEIAKQYGQLGKCCSIMSKISVEPETPMLHMYSGGWRLNEYEIKDAGIDIEEVYAHIQRLANKKRAELECELVKLET